MCEGAPHICVDLNCTHMLSPRVLWIIQSHRHLTGPSSLAQCRRSSGKGRGQSSRLSRDLRLLTDLPPYHREGGTLRHNGGSLDHGWTQKGVMMLIVLSPEADDLTLAQWLPTIATTSNQ